ncbi:hypothetical protein JCM3770_000469, partial [Rhodotorula araucariae]
HFLPLLFIFLPLLLLLLPLPVLFLPLLLVVLPLPLLVLLLFPPHHLALPLLVLLSPAILELYHATRAIFELISRTFICVCVCVQLQPPASEQPFPLVQQFRTRALLFHLVFQLPPSLFLLFCR